MTGATSFSTRSPACRLFPEPPARHVLDNRLDSTAGPRRCGPRSPSRSSPLGRTSARRNRGVAASPTIALTFRLRRRRLAVGARRARRGRPRPSTPTPSLAVIAARTLVGPDEALDPVNQEMARSRSRNGRLRRGGPPAPAIPLRGLRRLVPRRVPGGRRLQRRRVLFLGEEQMLALDLASAGWHLPTWTSSGAPPPVVHGAGAGGAPGAGRPERPAHHVDAPPARRRGPPDRRRPASAAPYRPGAAQRPAPGGGTRARAVRQRGGRSIPPSNARFALLGG